jgi:hypothetical protein
MGLYLCVFVSRDADDELEGVEVGSYDDFHLLRTTVAERLEGDQWASRFPVLLSHEDSDGEWTPQEALALSRELRTIEDELAALPAIGFPEGSRQSGVANAMGVVPASLAECFIDVDGEPLLERLRDLADLAAERGCPISFQ